MLQENSKRMLRMPEAVFVTDLHGRVSRYTVLFAYLVKSPPDILFIGGDLLEPFLPFADSTKHPDRDFINGFLAKNFTDLKSRLGKKYPETLIIMGNDDPKYFESALISAGSGGLWTYIHQRRIQNSGYSFYGYNYVPPTPFMLKDWERYDVSRYTDVGCISPEEGRRSFPASEHEQKWTTIKDDIDDLTADEQLDKAVFLFHAPPYSTDLDLGDVGAIVVDHVPVDEHLGSIAIYRFIEERQPLLTLHGHVHESARLSGSWMQKIGRTVCINGAHDGDELSVIRIPLDSPEDSTRLLI